jgi:hypothetical protein
MTEDKFLKTRFKGFQIITYHNERDLNIDGQPGQIMECMILAVDFDERLLKIMPIPNDVYEEKEFWCRCEHCEIFKEEVPKKECKLVLK